MARRLAWPSSSRTWPCQPCSPICSRVGWLWRTSPRGMPRSKMSSSRSPAGTCARTTMAASSYWPLWQLTISRMRIFYREPAAVFWVYGFPLVMALSLGTAFRENPTEHIRVDVVEAEVQGATSKAQSREGEVQTANGDAPSREGEAPAEPRLAIIDRALAANSRFEVIKSPKENWRKRLQSGKTDLVMEYDERGSYQLWDEPHRTESRLARHAVEA